MVQHISQLKNVFGKTFCEQKHSFNETSSMILQRKKKKKRAPLNTMHCFFQPRSQDFSPWERGCVFSSLVVVTHTLGLGSSGG